MIFWWVLHNRYNLADHEIRFKQLEILPSILRHSIVKE